MPPIFVKIASQVRRHRPFKDGVRIALWRRLRLENGELVMQLTSCWRSRGTNAGRCRQPLDVVDVLTTLDARVMVGLAVGGSCSWRRRAQCRLE